MLNYEELACVKDFAPHFDNYTKMQNWNVHSVYKVSSSEVYNKPKIWTKNSKNSEFAVL